MYDVLCTLEVPARQVPQHLNGVAGAGVERNNGSCFTRKLPEAAIARARSFSALIFLELPLPPRGKKSGPTVF